MDRLSSREWAIVTWIIIYLYFTIFVLKVDFTDVLKSFFNKKLNILCVVWLQAAQISSYFKSG